MGTKECPRAKSDMTPCVLKDGDMAIVGNSFGHEICVGCGEFVTKCRREAKVADDR
jgi:hypothetical protein